MNDGNESIELMINSLSSVTNADEKQNNKKKNAHIHRTKDICKLYESDISFNDTNLKDITQYGKLLENTPNVLNSIEPTAVEKLSTSTTKGVSKCPNKSKCVSDIIDCQHFHDIREIEPTLSRLKPTPCNNPLVLFTDCDKRNDFLDKQPLKVREPRAKKEFKEQQETIDQSVGNIKPKIIISNKEINSCNSNPTVLIKRSAMPNGQRENSKTINNTTPSENNSIKAVNTKGTKFIPIRNQQSSSMIRSQPLRPGIYFKS
jgi:hypothetical protein